ncbi:hypothetical protein M0802_004019 [Mischocyttarus mexicanus]|nr:hypothetical protein M0802_004019 [Mischocyttarus mexicanus]
MLKHILTGQPSSAGSRHHHNDYQTSSGSLHAGHHHHHQHNLLQQEQPQPQQQQQQQQQHHYGGNGSGGTIARGTSTTSARTNGIDVYDSVVHSSSQRPTATPATTTTSSNVPHHQAATTPSSAHRHPLNHSQLSVNNLSQRLNHSHALNLSTLSTSKHSVNSVSPVVGGSNNNNNNNGSNNINGHSNNNNNNLSSVPNQTVVGVQSPIHQDRPKANGGFDISRLSRLPSQTTPSPAPAAVHQPAMPVQIGGHPGPTVIPLNASWSSSLSRNHRCHEAGVKEMLTSLGLLCLVSLLLALLSLIFLLKISPLTVTPSSLISPEEYTIVYEVTLALCALALSLNLCCLLVCAIQFLFAVKLVKTSYQGHRHNTEPSHPILGMILYTFIQFHSTPAIVTSVFIGLGIVFCGCAMVHNVFVWQREKTNAVKALAREQCEAAAQLQRQQQQLQQNNNNNNNSNSNNNNNNHHHHHHHHQSHLLQQQQHQQHQQHQHQLRPNLYHSGCAPKIGSLTATYSNATLPHHAGNRSSQYQQHQHHHHHHHHRHLSSPMSPPLLLSSTSAPLASTHSLLNVATNRNVVTPPATPGDRSPPSPSNKFNRSHITREASGSVSPGLPAATLDLSSAATTNSPHELSTLV